MRTSMKHIFAKIALGGWLLCSAAGIANAGSKAMVYIHNYSQQERMDLLPGGKNVFDLNTETMGGSGRLILKTDAESRFEAELQGRAKDEQHHQANIAKMDALAANPAGAEALLGKGYAIEKANKPPRNVWDIYLDTTDGKLAGSNASLRIRIENGFATLNYKPHTRVDYDNGMVHRIEYGIKLGANAFDDNFKPSAGLLKFLAMNRADNPLRELLQHYPGAKLEDFFNVSAALKQVRSMYDVKLTGTKHGEFSVDKVGFADPAGLKHSQLATLVPAGFFYRVEMEGDHVGANPTAAQMAASAVAPHDAKDTVDPDNDNNKDIIELHRLADIFTTHLGTTPAGSAKITEARQRLNKPIAKMQTSKIRISLSKKTIQIRQPSSGGKPVIAKGPKGRIK
jgi:hypothetical protein